MITYQELKNKHQKELNDFPMAFAFDKNQFKKAMEELGLTEKDTDKVYSIGMGGFIRKTDSEALNAMHKRQQKEFDEAIKNDATGEGFIKEMFLYELANHEYIVTFDLEPTLDALGLALDEVNRSEA